ncbi:hypothetical protein LTSEHVI_1614, partial [Salmonella enterica subsp. enterica serovar Hvittingfoss str. A4-620]
MVIQRVVIKFIYLLRIKLTFRRKKGQHSWLQDKNSV